MLSVYNYMASGVLLTGIVALLFAPYAGQVLITPDGRGMSALGWVVTLSPLGDRVRDELRHQPDADRHAAAPVLGLRGADGPVDVDDLPRLYRAFDRADLLRDRRGLLGLSLYGYTTKRDLSGLGTFLIMGVVGLLVAMLINMFLHSSAMALAISAIGVLLFAGLTAYDTQRIKSIYFYVAGHRHAGQGRRSWAR